MATRMQQRRGTATMWTNANPILGVAEIGYETDTNKFKIGDGTNRWGDLSYFVDLDTMIQGAPGLLNSLDELAAAIGDDPSFFTTVGTNLSNHQADTTNIHGISDTADLATKSYVDSSVGNAAVDQSLLAGVGIDWNSTTEAFDIDSTVATKTYADGKASDAQTAAATDATTKANNAKSGAEATAASDATTKAATAKSEAITAAAADATTKADAAKAFATAADTTLRTAITTDIATAKSEAITAATNAVNAVIASAPAALDTLDELAAALGDDANYAATITTALAAKAPLASPALTGNPTAPTQTLGNDSTRVATTAFVKAAIQDIASLNLVLDGGGV
jgi:hypothetical protein